MSQSTTSVRESSRVFIGGLGIAVIAWLAWEGYIFRPVAEPVAVAIAGDDSSGRLGSGEFADLLAKMLTGALWALGELIWIALTVGYRFTSFIGVALVKWLLSFTDAGREFIGHWEDEDATAGASESPPIEDRISKHSEKLRQVVVAINAMTKSLNTIITRSNSQKDAIASMQDQLNSLKQAKSFAAWQRSHTEGGDE